MELLLLTARDVRLALPIDEAIAAAKQAFAAWSSGRSSMPPRGVVDVAGGKTLVMGGAVEGVGVAAKVVSVFAGNAARGLPAVNGLVVVVDEETGVPCAVVDGTFLTAWRTGAAGGAAADLLAREDARVGAVFGAGAQARTQAIALDAVRRLDELRVFEPSDEVRERFVDELAGELRAPIAVAASPEAAIDGADVVVTATTSARPVFDGDGLRDGAHVTAVGAFTADRAEVDARAIGRARVFVDAIPAALEEAGDLLRAEREGATRRDDWIELGAVVEGRAPGRTDDREITLFKSVGLAVQDVAAAARAVEGARELGLGTTVALGG